VKKFRNVLLVAIFIIGNMGVSVFAQEEGSMSNEVAEKTEEELAVEKAENEKKIAEAKLAEAQAKKSLKNLNLPQSETKGLEGKFTLKEGAGYYSELLAYDALDIASKTIAGQISKSVGDTLIISQDFNISQQFVLWDIINVRLTDYTTRINGLIAKYTDSNGDPELVQLQSLGAALAAAPQLLGAVTDVAKFFKTDTELSARKVNISNNALLAATSRAILTGGKVSAVYIQGFNLSTSGKLVSDTQTLMEKQIKAKQIKSGLHESVKPTLKELADFRKQLGRLKKELAKEHDGTKKNQIQQQIDTVEAEIAIRKANAEDPLAVAEKLFDDLDGAIVKFIDGITSRPDKENSILERVAQVDSFKANPNAQMLAIEVSSSGGEIERKSRVLISDRIRYLGGVVVSYFLFKNDGAMLASGIVPVWQGGKFKTTNGE